MRPWMAPASARGLLGRCGLFGLTGSREHDDAAAGLFDLLLGALGERVGGDRQLLLEFALTEDLHAHAATLNQARGAQRLFVHGGAGVEALEIAHVDGDGLDRKRNPESALRQSALDRS